jgi:hypothetical protein
MFWNLPCPPREEFTNYMFLERAEEASGTISENWRLFPPDFKDKNDPGVSHRGARCGLLEA